jgi:hypothetical protein
MSITRRRFLRAGSLVALSVAIPLKSVLGQGISKKDLDANPIDRSQEATADQLANYNKAAFASYLNSVFRLYTGYSTIEVTLVEVQDMVSKTVKPQPGSESFSLVFRGGNKTLDQGTYKLEHPSLGLFQLFLVPGNKDDKGAASFVAIINRVPYSSISPPSGTSKPPKTEKPEVLTPPAKPVEPAKAAPKTAAPTTKKPERAAPERTKRPLDL